MAKLSKIYNNIPCSCLIQQSLSYCCWDRQFSSTWIIQEWGYKIEPVNKVLAHRTVSVINFDNTVLLSQEACMTIWQGNLPHWRDFSLNIPPPNLSGNSSQASYIYLNFWPLRTPQPPGKFPIPSVGRVWIFLKLKKPSGYLKEF